MNEEEMNDLVFLWHEYALEEDANLTADAVELKRQIIEFVLSLPPFKEKSV